MSSRSTEREETDGTHQAYRSGDRRPGKDRRILKEHFGLTELYRRPTDTGDKGVWLSDGYIYFAILKYGDADAPKLGPGQTSDLRGIHHIGFQVDDSASDKASWRPPG